MMIAFDELYTLDGQSSGAFALGIVREKSGRRFHVRQLQDAHVGLAAADMEEWCAVPGAFVGDAPNKYHPLYVAALLTSRSQAISPEDVRIPAISFSTNADTRRSMTLNAMRMAHEYSQVGASLRIMRLVAQRLEVGQRDVVHDALVYVMRQIVSAREAARHEQELRGEVLTAYLGLPRGSLPALSPRRDARLCAALGASTRTSVDAESVAEMQRQILRSAMVPSRRAERHQLKLLDRIVMCLQTDAAE